MTKLHSPEYTLYINSMIWKNRAKTINQICGNRCCLFPWKRVNECHHLHYKNLKKEIVIRDCVPLSKNAHGIIHQNRFWNLNGNWRTPSRLRVWVSNYLRVVAILLILFNMVWTTVSLVFRFRFSPTKPRKK